MLRIHARQTREDEVDIELTPTSTARSMTRLFVLRGRGQGNAGAAAEIVVAAGADVERVERGEGRGEVVGRCEGRLWMEMRREERRC
jgi:hypothetical protein